MYLPHAYLRKATDKKERDHTSLPTAMSGLKGAKVAEGQICCFRILNINHGLHTELNQSPRSRKIIPGVHAFGTDGRFLRAWEPEK